MATPPLVDQYGRPLRRELLTQEVAGPSITGVRSPIAGYPSEAMNPSKLANLLREADQGEPLSYFELAEQIEEKDLHYAGVLSTRKRSVAQIEPVVEAASEDKEDVRRADLVREWLKRDELQDEMFDLMDAAGKGVSLTEIIWDSSDGMFWPERLEWRDPRWFTFDQQTMRRPLLRGGLDGHAQAEELPGFKFIFHQVKAKSGLPVRSGLARLVAWAWMFKAFTQRDWAIFTQTYGQPVRVGKYHPGATKEDKAALFRAVANIAGDCAAMIPESMMIEFVEAKNVTAGAELYLARVNWLDQQVSKAVLGQTTTTDAISGGHAVSKEHRQVQEDIETADCKSLAATINRDLIRPWMDINFGPAPRGRYPRLVIARPKAEDLKQLTESLRVFVPMGLKVEASEIRDKFGLSEPAEDAELLGAPAQPPESKPTEPPAKPGEAGKAPPPAKAGADTEEDDPEDDPAQVATQAAQGGVIEPPHPSAQIAAAMLPDATGAVEDMVATIETMLVKASDLGEFREMLSNAFGQLGGDRLAAILAAGLTVAQAAGRSDLVDESED